MSERIRKVNNLIKHRVSELLSRELSMKPGVFITVTKVDTAPDLRYSRISVSIFPEKDIDYAMQALKNEKGAIQKALHKKLSMKPLPKLSFIYDPTEAEADKIEKILLEL